MIRGLIFDLFGTLIHRKEGQPHPYIKLLRQQPRAVVKQALQHVMTSFCPTIRQLAIDLQLDFPNDEITKADKALKEDVEAIRAYPDTQATLQEIADQGLQMVLLSNLATPYIAPVNDLGLAPFFQHTLYSCEVGRAKPDVALYRLALKALDLPAEEVLMVGDSLRNDVASPRQLGIRTLHLQRPTANTSSGIRLAQTPTIADLYAIQDHLA